MKKEEKKPFIQCCILGAIGGILMAAGDWLLGCVPLQKTDTGMFNRACYLSGAYALWKPALVVGMGALGCFLYSFMVKALNTDIDARYSRTKAIQYFCGLFTVVVGIAISTGAAIAREIADITVSSEDLFALVTLRRLGQALMERIHGSYRFIVAFNLTLIALGVAGVLPPTTSALLHNGSTLGISLRNMTDLLDDEENPQK